MKSGHSKDSANEEPVSSLSRKVTEKINYEDTSDDIYSYQFCSLDGSNSKLYGDGDKTPEYSDGDNDILLDESDSRRAASELSTNKEDNSSLSDENESEAVSMLSDNEESEGDSSLDENDGRATTDNKKHKSDNSSSSLSSPPPRGDKRKRGNTDNTPTPDSGSAEPVSGESPLKRQRVAPQLSLFNIAQSTQKPNDDKAEKKSQNSASGSRRT